MDCRSVEKLLQRAVAGVPVSDGELEAALAHARTCELCGRRFEVGPPEAYLKKRDDLPDMAEPVEPTALFERALTEALSDSEPLVRIRAAERFGEFERLSPAPLAALARSAAEDADEEVRAAALMALDQLDEAVSLPQRLIEAWSATPAEAALFIADVLARLSAEGPPTSPGVIGLVGSAVRGGEEMELSGKEGISGLLTEEQSVLWLRLNRLPSSFEKTSPVVALPMALAEGATSIKWSGGEAGLVPAQTPVARGSLEVRLGNVVAPPEKEKLFERVYLLNPEAR